MLYMFTLSSQQHTNYVLAACSALLSWLEHLVSPLSLSSSSRLSHITLSTSIPYTTLGRWCAIHCLQFYSILICYIYYIIYYSTYHKHTVPGGSLHSETQQPRLVATTSFIERETHRHAICLRLYRPLRLRNLHQRNATLEKCALIFPSTPHSFHICMYVLYIHM